MDVYVIPIGGDDYELYCERLAALGGEDDTSTRWFSGLRKRFERIIREAENEEGREPAPPATGWWNRLQERIVAWVAERVAEQRLLWNLRGETETVAVHPQDMSFEQVHILITRMLQRDHDRHLRWVIIDGVLFVVTFVALGPLFLLIPGIANLPALYFGFRAVGHWLSMRGAAHGIHGIKWSGRPSDRLVDLRHAIARDPDGKSPEIRAIAADLELPRLAAFIDRITVR
jgi:hypothetical protein